MTNFSVALTCDMILSEWNKRGRDNCSFYFQTVDKPIKKKKRTALECVRKTN